MPRFVSGAEVVMTVAVSKRLVWTACHACLLSESGGRREDLPAGLPQLV